MTIKNFKRKEDGSITLEAAMILPFFLFFILFLTMFIRLAVADMALYKAASETTEVVSAYAYPFQLPKQGVTNLITNNLPNLPPEIKVKIDPTVALNWANDGLKFFGIDVQGSIENLFEGNVKGIIEPTLQEKFKEATGGWNFFDESNLKVTNVELPSLVGGSDDFLEINVEYRFDLSIPFVDKEIVLKKTAFERVWSGS